jgi:hypothetical protein
VAETMTSSSKDQAARCWQSGAIGDVLNDLERPGQWCSFASPSRRISCLKISAHSGRRVRYFVGS